MLHVMFVFSLVGYFALFPLSFNTKASQQEKDWILSTFRLMMITYAFTMALNVVHFKWNYWYIVLCTVVFGATLAYVIFLLTVQVFRGFFIGQGLMGREAEYESTLLHIVRWILQLVFIVVLGWIVSMGYLLFQICWVERDY